MLRTRTVSVLVSLLVGLSLAQAQSVRDHTRPAPDPGGKPTDPARARYRLGGASAGPTAVTESQAVDVTLTLSQAALRPIQVWVRTAGTIDRSGRVLTAYLSPPDSTVVKAGQRIRAFPPESKSSMYQAWVTRVVPEGKRARVEATLTNQGHENSKYYVMEIVVDRGDFLSVPNEAIIEEGDQRIVYVQQHPSHYVPQEVHTGIQGELYTQVLHGVTEGDQVVTFGSFFIDSENKLKSKQSTVGNDHHHH